MSSALLHDLEARGLIFQIAGEAELPGWLDGGMRTCLLYTSDAADEVSPV